MNKENWNKFLSEIIKSSINNFDMIGDNLRVQCVEYFEQLETNIEDAIGYIKYCQTSDKDIFPVIEAEKMIEILERGKEL